MEKIKKVIAIILTVLTLTTAGVSGVTASAANRNTYNCSTSYTHYRRMKITNKKQSGSATFGIWCLDRNTKTKVKLTNGAGKWLWESNLGYVNGYYYFYLGNNNSSYRFYFKRIGKSNVSVSFAYGTNITLY